MTQISSNLLQQLVAFRQEQAPILDHVKQQLIKLDQLLQSVKQHYHTHASTIGDSDFIRTLPTFQSELLKLIKQTDFVKSRFSKDSICIGVAGGARMGKSTLLQTLTALDNDIIPSSNGTQTTGARSIMYHHVGNPYAMVEYYSSDEILDGLITDYYTALNALDLKPSYLDAFLESPLYPDESKLDIIQRSKLQKLKDVQAALKKEQANITAHPKPQHIDIEHVKEYVSQVDGRSKYIIVKNVKIYTKFNTDKDLTKLSIIDLPGLGEIAIGHEKRLISALETEVDALLVVKKPSHDGSIWESDRDIGLFQTIQETVPSLNLKHWLFCVLNKTINPVSNEHVIEKLLAEKHVLPKGMSIYVCDATDQKEVEELFLEKVLKHIQDNLKMIDKAHIDEIKHKLETLKSTIIEKLLLENPQTGSEVDVLIIFKKFEDAWNEMKSTFSKSLDALNNLRLDGQRSQSFKMNIEFGKSTGEKMVDFSQYLLIVRDHLMDHHMVPPTDQLERLYEISNREWPQVVLNVARILRTHLSRELSEKINYFLNYSFEQEFDNVFNHALSRPVKGLIANACQNQEVDSWKDRFKLFREKYTIDNQAQYPIIDEAIAFLLQCNFDYYTLFHSFTREGLGALDFSNKENQVEYFLPKSEANLKPTTEYAEEVRRALITTYQSVLYDIIQKLSTEKKFKPRDSIYYILCEFNDRITELKYQKADSSEWLDVKEEWSRLLITHKNTAWAEFEDIQKQKKTLIDWSNLINLLKTNVSQLVISNQQIVSKEDNK
jgi:hypothetical protein